jgi:mRNA-degrading endonuclease toxin of MazEF toxin-antitoxin module
MTWPLRGEIHWIDWSPHRGSEQAGIRAGLVISADAYNRITHVCTVLALTTKLKQSELALTLPNHVTGKVCQVLPWQIMTISENRLEGFITTLDEQYMAQVEVSLKCLWRLT